MSYFAGFEPDGEKHQPLTLDEAEANLLRSLVSRICSLH